MRRTKRTRGGLEKGRWVCGMEEKEEEKNEAQR